MNFAGVKAIAIPEGDVKQIAIGGVTVWRKLPYDAEVDYIKTNGTQYIDTGVAPGNNEVEWDYRFYNLGGTTRPLFGARQTSTAYDSGAYNVFGLSAGVLRLDCTSTGSAVRTPSFPSDTLITLAYGGGYTTVNGTKYANKTKSTCDYPLLVCSINTGGVPATSNLGRARIVALRIWMSGVLVRDFQPVRVGSVGYLYDRANPTGGPSGNGLYGNAGTDSFTLGPDKNGFGG